MITIRNELFKDCYEELKPLFKKNWEEVEQYTGLEFSVDYNRYAALELADILHITIARNHGKIIGYMLDFIQYHMHYLNDKFAINDVFYVIPDFRGTKIPLKIF